MKTTRANLIRLYLFELPKLFERFYYSLKNFKELTYSDEKITFNLIFLL